MAFLLGLSLFTFKIPLFIQLARSKYAARKNKTTKGFLDIEAIFVADQVVSEVGYQFLMMTFLVLTLVHPLFAGFILM